LFWGPAGGRAPWIFIRVTAKVERGVMVLFFGLFFPLAHLKMFLPTPLPVDHLIVMGLSNDSTISVNWI